MSAVLEPPAPKPSAKDRNAELQQTVSASRLGLWHSCRLKFYFRYLLQLRKPPTPSMHAGSTVHGVLQAWNRSRWRREPFLMERFKGVFDAQWKALPAETPIKWDEGEEEADRSSSWRALENYFTETYRLARAIVARSLTTTPRRFTSYSGTPEPVDPCSTY